MMPLAWQIEELTLASFPVAGAEVVVAISVPYLVPPVPSTHIWMGPLTFRAVLTINGVRQRPLWSREPKFKNGSIVMYACSTSAMQGFWCRACGGITNTLGGFSPGEEVCKPCAPLSSGSRTFLIEYQNRLIELDPRPTTTKPNRVPLYLLRSWSAPWDMASVEDAGRNE